jgi:hypothetical protein
MSDEADELDDKIKARQAGIDRIRSVGKATVIDAAVRLAGAIADAHMPGSGLVAQTAAKTGFEVIHAVASSIRERREQALIRELQKRVREGEVPPTDDKDQEKYEQVLFHTYRHLMSLIDEATIPALARLTAEYEGGKKPDGFFRNMGQALELLDADDLSALSDLLSHLEAYVGELDTVEPGNDGWMFFDVSDHQLGGRCLRISTPTYWRLAGPAMFKVQADISAWRNLCDILVNQMLLRRTDAATSFDSNDQAFVLHRDTLRRLLDIVRGPLDDL